MDSSACSSEGDASPVSSVSTMASRPGSASAACTAALRSRSELSSSHIDSKFADWIVLCQPLRRILAQVDKDAVHVEMDEARAVFHRLLDEASEEDLRRRSNGTRWTNRQLLFHMLLGYLIVRALLTLVRLFGRLPAGCSRAYARLLNAATRPFDVVNYIGSVLGGTFLTRRRMGVMFDRTVAALHRRLDAESDADLARGMHYPTRWDPFFKDFMTLADVYHFPTQHLDFHRRQLTITVDDERGH